MEMVRMAESGERKFVCKVCGKGFKTKYNLSAHGTTHTKAKASSVKRRDARRVLLVTKHHKRTVH